MAKVKQGGITPPIKTPTVPKKQSTLPFDPYAQWPQANPQPTTVDVTPIAGAATEAKQDTGNASLASILAKIIAAPATEAKQDTMITALQLIDNLVKAEDDASANLDPGIVMLARRTAAPANTSGSNLDYEVPQMANGALWVRDFGPGTGTQANVSGAASSTAILASNTSRRGASVWNDSTAILYLLLGTGTASATVCSVKLVADAYFEVPAGYTGALTGIWASATGSARVTEWT